MSAEGMWSLFWQDNVVEREFVLIEAGFAFMACTSHSLKTLDYRI